MAIVWGDGWRAIISAGLVACFRRAGGKNRGHESRGSGGGCLGFPNFIDVYLIISGYASPLSPTPYLRGRAAQRNSLRWFGNADQASSVCWGAWRGKTDAERRVSDTVFRFARRDPWWGAPITFSKGNVLWARQARPETELVFRDQKPSSVLCIAGMGSARATIGNSRSGSYGFGAGRGRFCACWRGFCVRGSREFWARPPRNAGRCDLEFALG